MNDLQNPKYIDPQQEETLDLKRLFFKYLPYWPWFVLSVALGLGLAFLYNLTTEPMYRVRASMLIKDDYYSWYGSGGFMRELDMFGQQSSVLNESIILQSYALVDKVVQQMDVDVSYYILSRRLGAFRRYEAYKEAPIRVVWDDEHPQPFGRKFELTIIDGNSFELWEQLEVEGLEERRRYPFGHHFSGQGYSFRVFMVAPYDPAEHHDRSYQFIINRKEGLTAQYQSRLSVELNRNSASIVDISFLATNRQRASDFVNLLTETYIQRGLDDKNQTARNTIFFIDEQIAQTSESLDMAESNLQEFRQARRLTDVSLQATQLLNDMQALDKQRSVEQVKRQYYDFLSEYVSDARDFSEVFGPTSLGIEDPLLNNLIIELSRLYGERSRLLLTATERSPSVQALDRNISLAKASLEETIRSVRATSDIQLADLNRRIRQLERRISELPRTERELVGIQRMFNLSDETYNYLLQKRTEAGIALASNVADHRIIDQARFAGQTEPKTQRNYAIALMMALALPAIILVLSEFLNTKIIDKGDVTRVLNFPILGIIPHHKAGRKKDASNLQVYKDKRSPLLEAFRTMRSNLQYFASGKENKVIVVTSTRSMEGKSFTAVNLAAVMAMSGRKTLLIGGDLRKPTLHKDLGVQREPGLSNYLIGKARIEEVVQRSPDDNNLFVIASGPAPPNPTELLDSPRMKELLHQLSGFDTVVIDSPPVGVVSDAQPLIALADLCVYVVRQRFTQHAALEFVKEFTEKAGIKNMVININDVKLSTRRYGYGHGYGYGYGYGYAYGYGYHEEEKKKRKG